MSKRLGQAQGGPLSLRNTQKAECFFGDDLQNIKNKRQVPTPTAQSLGEEWEAWKVEHGKSYQGKEMNRLNGHGDRLLGSVGEAGITSQTERFRYKYNFAL